jgi:hypothetical protein
MLCGDNNLDFIPAVTGAYFLHYCAVIQIFFTTPPLLARLDSLVSPSLKGQCHEMDIFLGLNNLISTFFVCFDGFPGLNSISLPYT